MARAKRSFSDTPDLRLASGAPVTFFNRSRINKSVLVPPLDGHEAAYRYTTAIRFGKSSFERFCKNNERRKELGLRPLPTAELE